MIPAQKEYISRFILGTAQFGLAYGISNHRGQIPQQEVQAILQEAGKAGITTLDTAAAYGESERSIGKALQGRPHDLRIISKHLVSTPEKSIKAALEESLDKLGVEKLYGYLLHNYSSYVENPGLLKELLDLKAAGKVEKTGVSLYHPQEAEVLITQSAAVDIVQFPYSVFDRRFESILPRLRKAGIEAHARSVFLQGLYFLPPDRLSPHFESIAPKLEELQRLARKHHLPLGAMLLGFVLANLNITNIVVGVESLETLQQNIGYCTPIQNSELLASLKQLREDDEMIILPTNWPKE